MSFMESNTGDWVSDYLSGKLDDVFVTPDQVKCIELSHRFRLRELNIMVDTIDIIINIMVDTIDIIINHLITSSYIFIVIFLAHFHFPSLYLFGVIPPC